MILLRQVVKFPPKILFSFICSPKITINDLLFDNVNFIDISGEICQRRSNQILQCRRSMRAIALSRSCAFTEINAFLFHLRRHYLHIKLFMVGWF